MVLVSTGFPPTVVSLLCTRDRFIVDVADRDLTTGFGRGNGARMRAYLGPRAERFAMINVRQFGSHPVDVGG